MINSLRTSSTIQIVGIVLLQRIDEIKQLKIKNKQIIE